MTFLRNTWYMLGWSNELDAGFVHRTIAEEPILAYRLESGRPAAIHDRCPHRFVPLHRGKQVGDTVECGYHGLCFDADGKCVKNPVDGAIIPKAAQVRAYPIVDRYGVLWVWLGDPAKADPDRIVRYDFLVDPRRSTVQGYMLTRANYELAIDNLSDLTHVQYVHGEYQASEVFARLTSEVFQNGNTITTRLTLPNGRVPYFFANAVPDADAHIDLVYDVEWNPPSVATLKARGYQPGDRNDPIFDIQSAHIISPETRSTCHYFFGNSRNYAVGDAAADEKVREWQRIGFVDQDKPMLEAQQLSVGDRDILSMNPVLLATDAGSVRIRRTLKALIDAEAAA